jgi:uncharacterized membrane protein YphA (DoxX/SURF4 family)
MRKYLLIPTLGIAFVFIYFGIDKFMNPIIWIGWQPAFMDGLLGFSKANWNSVFGVIETIIGLLILFPKTRWIGALIASLHLIPIIYITFLSDIAVRDIGLFSMAIYLFLSTRPRQNTSTATV